MRERLVRLGYKNVAVREADGGFGLPEEAPFDAIVVTAGAAKLPPAFSQQLSEGGRIVIPIGRFERSQHLYRFRRNQGDFSCDDLGSFAFVPLIGEAGWR